jgi:NADH:ubiquinone reductase (H+-translocating)
VSRQAYLERRGECAWLTVEDGLSTMDVPHVVILGGGFAGLGAMRKLKNTPVRVTLIDKNDYHTFLPLLYQVATGQLGSSEVGYSLHEALPNRDGWTFKQAKVTAIDPDNKTVTPEGMAPVSYDYLVLGLGAVVNYFGTKGAAENAFPLYTMDNAQGLRERIMERFEAAARDPALIDDGALTFCVVGGGATGVEVSGAIAELLNHEMREDFPDPTVDSAEVHLYEMNPALLGPFKPRIQEYAKEALEERGVQVHLGEGVVEIEPTRVHLTSGRVVKAHTLVWAAGIAANPISAHLGVELEAGRVPVNPDLSLAGRPEVFVIGDIAMITDNGTNTQLPQLGSVALQAGSQAGTNIARLVKGQTTEPFKYKDKGTMAAIGRGAAVVQFRRGRTMTGRAAWMAWLGVHLALLSGGEQKVLTLLAWGRDTLTHGRGKRRASNMSGRDDG